MLNVLIPIVVGAIAFVLGMIFNAPTSNEKKIDEEKFILENAKVRGFCFRANPVISNEITNGSFLKYLYYLRGTAVTFDDNELQNLVRNFWQQERQMQYLYLKIVNLLFRMNLDESDYPYLTLQKCFDVYANNRLEICKAVRSYVDTEDLGLKEQYRLVLSDLKFDNDNLLRPIMSFFVSLSGYLENVKEENLSSNDSDKVDGAESRSAVIQRLMKDFASDIRVELIDADKQEVLDEYLKTWRRVYYVV